MIISQEEQRIFHKYMTIAQELALSFGDITVILRYIWWIATGRLTRLCVEEVPWVLGTSVVYYK